jgi:hypothetical protein
MLSNEPAFPPSRVSAGGRDTSRAMFALTGGELAMVSFLFALVWGAGLLPRLGERLGERFGGAPGPGRGKSDGG